jgi:hypothetical protein
VSTSWKPDAVSWKEVVIACPKTGVAVRFPMKGGKFSVRFTVAHEGLYCVGSIREARNTNVG